LSGRKKNVKGTSKQLFGRNKAVEGWVCQTAFQPTSCIHATITTNPPQ